MAHSKTKCTVRGEVAKVSHCPARYLRRKSLGTKKPKVLSTINCFFETAFIGKIFGYKVIDLLEKNYFYMEYLFVYVVIIKV